MQNGGHELARRVFRHFADASANCDYVTPLKSTSIIIIYDVITRWQTGGGGSKTAGEATKKNMQKPIAFDICSHNVSYTQCEAGRQASRASFVHVLRIRHAARGTPWSDFGKSFFLLMHLTWLLIKHTHTDTRRTTDTRTQLESEVKQSHFVIESGNLNESAGNAIDMTIVITIDIDIDNRQSNNCCGFAPAQTA